jgi:hypothetical protein
LKYSTVVSICPLHSSAHPPNMLAKAHMEEANKMLKRAIVG